MALEIVCPTPSEREEISAVLRSGNFDVITDDGLALPIQDQVIEGFIPEVFDVTIDSSHYALKLPVFSEIRVYNEPENTETIRNLGVPTNPFMETRQFYINGIPTPGILMAHTVDIPFDVRFAKGSKTSMWRFPLVTDLIDDDTLPQLFSEIVPEIALLAQSGFFLQSPYGFTHFHDCINFAVFPNSSLHLYLNDLGPITFIEMEEEAKMGLADYLLMVAIRHCCYAVPNNVFEDNLDYFTHIEREMWPYEEKLQLDAFWELHEQIANRLR